MGRTVRLLLSALMTAGVMTGCGVLRMYRTVADPLTPEQSRIQVVSAARHIVDTLKLPVVEAFFWRASCSDDRRGPFQARLRIGYPRAVDHRTAEAEMAVMIERLIGAGWSGDPVFRSHSAVLRRDDVHALLRPQNSSTPTRNIELLGPCRDVTTTRAAAGRTEAIDLR